jgi:hypothetical protein
MHVIQAICKQMYRSSVLMMTKNKTGINKQDSAHVFYQKGKLVNIGRINSIAQ